MPESNAITGSIKWRSDVALRSWQREALIRWCEGLRGIVKVVTGAGKTSFAEQCLRMFHDKFPSGKSIIIVPTTALLDQWYVSLLEDLDAKESEIACFSGEGKAPHLGGLTIFVINTARRISESLRPQDDTFLIVDECHRAGSLVNSQALKAPHKATLGLSATPERSFDTGFEEHLVPSLGEIIFTYDYAAAHRDGVIVPFELINVTVNLLADENKAYQKLTKRAAKEFRRIQREGGGEERLKHILRKRASVSA